MNQKVVVDAHAWISYFEGKSEAVRKIIEGSELHTSVFNVAEVTSRAERSGKSGAEVAVAINRLSRVWGVSIDEVARIGELHAEMRRKTKDFGLGDCFVLELAERLGARILTGDKHFRGLKNVIMV